MSGEEEDNVLIHADHQGQQEQEQEVDQELELEAVLRSGLDGPVMG